MDLLFKTDVEKLREMWNGESEGIIQFKQWKIVLELTCYISFDWKWRFQPTEDRIQDIQDFTTVAQEGIVLLWHMLEI